jgi:uncharacterized protein YraI
MVQPKTKFLAALALLACAATAQAEPAVVASRLNLRSGPGPAFGVIVVMSPGAKVDVQKCHGTWCRVKHKRRVGYTSRAYLKFGTDAYAAVTPLPEPPPETAAPTLEGPRIWRWRDRAWRNRHWREFGWRNRHRKQVRR